MVTLKIVIKLLLSFPEMTEEPHFEKKSYRVNKKIVATLDEKKQQVVVKFSEIDQSVFCAYDPAIIYPVQNKWGKQGWTIIELKKVRKDLLIDALTCAYCNIAPPKILEKYKLQKN